MTTRPGSAIAVGASTGGRVGRVVHHLWQILPEGQSLPREIWERHHRAVLWVLWLHAVGIAGYGLFAGSGWAHGLGEGGLLAGIALLAGMERWSRHVRAGLASLGLITASAMLVHLSGGYIEVHFHFFVMLALIAVYQDWVP